MNSISLLVAFGLALVWAVAHASGSAPPWVTWPVLLAAAVILINTVAAMTATRRRAGAA